jgi:hypothetical protein
MGLEEGYGSLLTVAEPSQPDGGMSAPRTPDRPSAGGALPSSFEGSPYLRGLGAADQEVLVAVFTADEDDDDDDYEPPRHSGKDSTADEDDDDDDYDYETPRHGGKEHEPLSAMVPFAGGGGLQTRREDERSSHARNDGTLRMVGGDDDEFESDGEIVSVQREP